MRRLGFLTPVSLFLLGPGCTRDNPAFDNCETECAGETLASGDGDGDPTGDGDSGDGDGDAGDGDGDAGDGDGDGDPSGDGDGDTGEMGLPKCPDAEWVVIPLLKDTFLDGTEDGAQGCVIDWDFDMDTAQHNMNLSECQVLDFGACTGHWVCGEGSCNSMWLGKYDLGQWLQAPVDVVEAGLQFTVKYQNGEPNSAFAYELDVTNINFGDCGEWHAGDGHGDPPMDCVTTFQHSAHPTAWPASLSEQLAEGTPIGESGIPPTGEEYVEQTFVMEIDPGIVRKWLTEEKHHDGVVLSSKAGFYTQFYLMAQGSGHDPELHARLCEL